mmetsp:Transcript_21579/g.36116  ORF Transcript_21579/g.36116 Transcript_21579/m.36116 type:complete len:118 (+) Transcript_21579:66-419(+)
MVFIVEWEFTLQDVALDEVVHDQGEIVAREEDADIKEMGHLCPDRETREDVKTFDDDDLVRREDVDLVLNWVADAMVPALLLVGGKEGLVVGVGLSQKEGRKRGVAFIQARFRFRSA